uniref:Ig-like domain-containing protein n=1 Tax=Neolamprologus brichardi TaxID=32507 RepID=A0A3Q4GFJ7_NEOBR
MFCLSGTPVTRVTVKEDDGVILPCSLSTNENIESMLFDWKIEGTVPQKNVFLYDDGKYYNNGLSGQDEEFKDRVSHFPEELKHGNASIRIKKTRLEDNGTYLCKFPKLKPEIRTFHIELVVGPPDTRVIVLEDDDVILPCSLSTNQNIEKELFVWKKEGTVPLKEVFMFDDGTYSRGQDDEFKGRVSHFPEQLKHGNASIRMKQTRLEDNGNYTCSFPVMQLSVKTFPNYLRIKQSACTSGRASPPQHICSDICNIW